MSDIPPAPPHRGDDGQSNGMSPGSREGRSDQAFAGFLGAVTATLRFAGVVTAVYLLLRILEQLLHGPTIVSSLPMLVVAVVLAVGETVKMYQDIESGDDDGPPPWMLVSAWGFPLLVFAFCVILPSSRLWAGAAYCGVVAGVHLIAWSEARERWSPRAWLPRRIMRDLGVPPVYQLGVKLVLLVWAIAAFLNPYQEVREEVALGIDALLTASEDAILELLPWDGGEDTLRESRGARPPTTTNSPDRPPFAGERPPTEARPAVTTTSEPSLEDLCDGVTDLHDVEERTPALEDAMEEAWTDRGGREVGCPSGRFEVTEAGAVIAGLQDGESDPAAVVGSLSRPALAHVVFEPRMPLLDELASSQTLVAVGERTDLGENSDYQAFFTTRGCVLSFRDRGTDPDHIVTFPEEVSFLLLELAEARSSLIWAADHLEDTPPFEAYVFELFNPVTRRLTEAEVLRDPVRASARLSSLDGKLPPSATVWIESPTQCPGALEAFDLRAADYQRRIADAQG